MKSQNWNIYNITIFAKLLYQALRDGKEGKIHLQVYIFGREVELNQTLHQLVLLRQSGMSKSEDKIGGCRKDQFRNNQDMD